MSKTSHSRHEHKHHNDQPDDIVTAGEMDQDFSKHHKVIIVILVVVMIVMLPLLFAAGSLLRMIHW